MKTGYPRGLNKGLGSKFHDGSQLRQEGSQVREGSRVQQEISEEVWRAHWLKHCTDNN